MIAFCIRTGMKIGKYVPLKGQIIDFICTHPLHPLHPFASGKELTCQCRRHKRFRFHPWVGKIPWRRKQKPTPVFLPEKSHGQRGLVGYRLWAYKDSDMTERLSTKVVSKKFRKSIFKRVENV